MNVDLLNEIGAEISYVSDDQKTSFPSYILPFIVQNLPKILEEKELEPFVRQHKKIKSLKKQSNTHFPLFDDLTN